MIQDENGKKADEWGPTGISSLNTQKTFFLSQEHKEELIGLIGDHPEKEKFTQAIEEAINEANRAKSIRESTKPSKVRENISTAIESIEKLFSSFNSLDPHSLYLLSRDSDNSGLEEVISSVRSFESKLKKALKVADNYPKRGKLYQGHERWLACLICEAITDILKIKPTLTHNETSGTTSLNGAIYGECLRFALRVSGFRKEKTNQFGDRKQMYILNLMKEGLEIFKSREIEGGVITYRKGSI